MFSVREFGSIFQKNPKSATKFVDGSLEPLIVVDDRKMIRKFVRLVRKNCAPCASIDLRFWLVSRGIYALVRTRFNFDRKVHSHLGRSGGELKMPSARIFASQFAFERAIVIAASYSTCLREIKQLQVDRVRDTSVSISDLINVAVENILRDRN